VQWLRAVERNRLARRRDARVLFVSRRLGRGSRVPYRPRLGSCARPGAICPEYLAPACAPAKVQLSRPSHCANSRPSAGGKVTSPALAGRFRARFRHPLSASWNPAFRAWAWISPSSRGPVVARNTQSAPTAGIEGPPPRSTWRQRDVPVRAGDHPAGARQHAAPFAPPLIAFAARRFNLLV